MFTHVFFDLDGTLIDPFVGITRSIQHALERMGADVPPAEDLRWCIGPPLWGSFEVLLQTTDRSVQDAAVAYYRERFTVNGLYEYTLIEGVSALAQNLKQRGKTLCVVTSKPHAYAGKIVAHAGLMPFFKTVYGSELDGTRSDKSDLIAYVLESEAAKASSCVMVGDRRHDLVGAHANGVAGIGVGWGYGSHEELLGEQPALLAKRPKDILDWFSNVA
ncbi:phosphoglycolate phosphatase [Roseibium hamelinense]|uniref:Phosphoglycolate phosphatase n=1 Tax=Roseibium hamelinense TaxID=150831 RepID=A0A562SFA3_9HYPH|nr:HAD hydrolase-like protein [Roseibium hamelinense]MTI44160.1 HAD family hydrolase [Roseibium hamelinense]TWI80057.1 phosphoglycolate phosphatase [Roseibium hamelinense]